MGFLAIWVTSLFLVWSTASALQLPPEAEAQSPENPLERALEWRVFSNQFPPFSSYAEVEKFLQTARVLSMAPVGEGVNNPKKILLEKDGIRMNAVFRDVQFQFRDTQTSSGKAVRFFRDDAIFEAAAYRLGRLLGLENIPPTVVRKIGGKEGTLQAWIENSKTLKTLQKENSFLPKEGVDRWRWNMERQGIYIFDNLIYNEDRNLGNILIGTDKKIWMIDHTRAFRRWQKLPYPEHIQHCERQLWERLRTLDQREVRQQLRGLLTPAEVSAVLERGQLLVGYIQELIAQKGEQRVLFDWR